LIFFFQLKKAQDALASQPQLYIKQLEEEVQRLQSKISIYEGSTEDINGIVSSEECDRIESLMNESILKLKTRKVRLPLVFAGFSLSCNFKGPAHHAGRRIQIMSNLFGSQE
jgi:hypothetical protein